MSKKKKIVPITDISESTPRLETKDHVAPITYFGEMGIDFDHQVVDQIYKAASLPVTVRAAVMPDGHVGYALPIGGVVAMENAVSPSFVGYDIACRMTVTILDISPHEFQKKRASLAHDMQAVSRFGVGANYPRGEWLDDPVMDDPLWNELSSLKSLKTLAHEQLGTSGGGNHFFDALIGTVTRTAEWLPLPQDAKFVAIMTHSGSRGTGNKLAQHYQKLAKQETNTRYSGIPEGYEWLELDRDSGREYWNVMQLMGRYAQANHLLIHNGFLRRSGLSMLARWENHHNFAFLENGLVIHRKGATPADPGRVGIIPGSSGTPSYLVEGLGNPESLNSSSHGAGRPRSRSASIHLHNDEIFRRYMKQKDILYFGINPDETYMAYKDIERVIQLQDGVLVNTVARMSPSVVVMGTHSDDGD